MLITVFFNTRNSIVCTQPIVQFNLFTLNDTALTIASSEISSTHLDGDGGGTTYSELKLLLNMQVSERLTCEITKIPD